MNEAVTQAKPITGGMGRVVYVLYLVSILLGITGVVGVVIAYVNKDNAPEWLKSHYQFQIRTFWIGLLYVLIGSLLSFVLIGYLVILFWVVWLIIRCAKGVSSLGQKAAHPNPTGWMF